jgi:divalent metal cation (Fe/Co/Zn/Cd) transporter
MPKFSIKDMLMMTTTLAVGIGSIAYISRPPLGYALLHGSPGNAELTAADKFELMLILFGGGALIGAALLMPFKGKWPWIGALLGVLIQVGIFKLVMLFR